MKPSSSSGMNSVSTNWIMNIEKIKKPIVDSITSFLWFTVHSTVLLYLFSRAVINFPVLSAILPDLCSLIIFFIFDVKRGIRLKATKRETSRLKLMVKLISLKSWPAIPGTKRTGTKTARVVRVEAVIAIATSFAPFTAASRGFSPFSLRLKILSSTTIELSTSIPTASARPAREMMLISRPKAYIAANVTIIDIGIEIPTVIELLKDRRKKSKTRIAMKNAFTPVPDRLLIESLIYSAWFQIIDELSLSE